MVFEEPGANTAATSIVFTIEVLATIIAVILAYRVYGSVTKRPWYVTASVYFFWPLCFFVPLMIPNDVVRYVFLFSSFLFFMFPFSL